MTRIGDYRYIGGTKDLVLTGKALADPSRVRVLMALRGRELCVCELCDGLGIAQSTLSTHLRVIRKAGLVSARKEGKWMYYAVAPKAKKLVGVLFQFFRDSLQADTALQKDAKKLFQRLSMRDNGSCCVGFSKVKSLGKRAKK